MQEMLTEGRVNTHGRVWLTVCRFFYPLLEYLPRSWTQPWAMYVQDGVSVTKISDEWLTFCAALGSCNRNGSGD